MIGLIILLPANLSCVAFFNQVRQLLQNSGKGHVVATCRNPESSSGLLDLKNMFAERLSILQLDVTVERTIEVVLYSLFFVII